MLKQSAMLVGGFLMALSLALAGCTFQGDVEHRVVLDDAQGKSVEVKEKEEPQRVMIENKNGSERADVELKVTRVSEEAATVLVRIEGPDGELLTEREIVVGDANETDGNETEDETDGNETEGNQTDGSDGSQEEVVVIQNIDVKGKDNIVVVNEAIEGDANVEVKAKSSDGAQEPEPDGNVTSQG